MSTRDLGVVIASTMLASTAFASPFNASNNLPACLPFSAASLSDDNECIDCIKKSVMITDPSVVGEMGRPPAREEWTLQHLFTHLGGASGGGSTLIGMLKTIGEKQTINGFIVEPRSGIRTELLEPWITASEASDLNELTSLLNNGDEAAWSTAPLKLAAIGYRPDIARRTTDPSTGEIKTVQSAGEGRFVFQVVDASSPRPMTLILEYGLEASSPQELIEWATAFDALSEIEFGPIYNESLALLTSQFTDTGSSPTKPNNVSLNQLRTNEFFNVPWELREFRVDDTGLLAPSTVKQNPDLSFNDDKADLLLEYINKEFSDEQSTPIIPWSWNGENFLAGSAITPVDFVTQPDTWLRPGDVTGITPAQRQHFAGETCNGCHGNDAPPKEGLSFNTTFTHIDLRGQGRGFGHPNILLSESLCEKELIDRMTVMTAFVSIANPEEEAAMLFNDIKSGQDMSEASELMQRAHQILKQNRNRTH